MTTVQSIPRGIALALALLLVCVGQARAGVMYTLNDTTNHVSATATFTLVSGGLDITVNNTESNTPDAGHAISQFQFTIGGTHLGLPTAFTKVSGTITDFSTYTTPVTDSPASGQTDVDHWNFFKSGSSTVNLFDVSTAKQPKYLIVALGSTPNSSLTNTHIPSFIGPVSFFLADSHLPATLSLSDITGVKFAFGTGPEVGLEAGIGSITQDIVPAPEPSTIVMVAASIPMGLVFWCRRRKRAAA
jgi:hypothetical protein